MATAKTTDGTQPYGLAFAPAGDRLAVGYNDTTAVSLFDGHTLTPLPGPDTRGLDNGNLMNVAWSVDGATLYAGGAYHNRAGTHLVMAWSGGGVGPRREWAAGTNTSIKSLRPLPDGGLLVGAGGPWLAVLDAAGAPRGAWPQRPPQVDLRGQARTLRVSADGGVVEFGYEVWGQAPARFELARLALDLDPPADGRTRPPEQATLTVADWEGTFRPTLNGAPLALVQHERSRSLAIDPKSRYFVLGGDWYLRAFAADGTPRWRQPTPGVVWATNITADGRLVVAAYGDGTLRWHRIDDGSELLALLPLADRRNWVAWTPDGYYAASPGARGVLRWHVNKGWDAPAEAIPLEKLPESYEPDVVRLVLKKMSTRDAREEVRRAKIAAALERHTGTAVAPPGARLHVLTVGVNDYGPAAAHLRLAFAEADATSVAEKLLSIQDSTHLYAKVHVLRLANQDATRIGILEGLDSMVRTMARGEGHDLAVVHFSGHGELIDDEFYLLPHDVDVSRPAAIKATALPASDLHRELAKLARYGRVLVLLDACRSGGANAAQLRKTLVGANIAVFTSSSEKELSREDPRWGNGAFTKIFLEALSGQADTNRNGLISISELTGYLRDNVPGLTDGAQHPGVEVHFDSDVFVAGL